MDRTGRITKRNRRYLKPILPFNHQLDNHLPLQTFPDELVRNTVVTANDLNNTGPTAVSREATTSSSSSHTSKGQPAKGADKSRTDRVTEPDTLPQSQPMSDDDFNRGLLKAARNVLTIPQQNEGTRPEAINHPTKRVRISTKRYISEY